MVWPAEAASIGLGGGGFPCSTRGQRSAGEGMGSGRARPPGPLTPGLMAARPQKSTSCPMDLCHLSHIHTVSHRGSVCIIAVRLSHVSSS